ncbi:MAG: hypothetical protein AAGK05_02775 [Pseudomonadota bacterium]
MIHFNLNSRFNFNNSYCNKDFSYEPELFPAALFSKWLPIHITLFSNGKGMITGVKCVSKASQILSELPAFLIENAIVDSTM